MKVKTFTLDDICVEWYEYHFADSWLRNDISWSTWRVALQKSLQPEQLSGKACAICGKLLPAGEPRRVEFVGGYCLRTCVVACQQPIEQDIKQAAKDA